MKNGLKFQTIAKSFHWGPVVEVHEIGPYRFVEYHPQIFKNHTGTGAYESTLTNFHIYIGGKDQSESAENLDAALAIAIARRHEGPNSRAGRYFIRMIGAGVTA